MGLGWSLSDVDGGVGNYRTHCDSPGRPFLALAAVDGYGRLGAWADARPRPRLTAPGALLAFAFLAAAALTARTVNDLAVPRWMPTAEQRELRRLLPRIPPEAAVSTNERLVPHLATRREVYIFPVLCDLTAYLLDPAPLISRPALPAHRPL